MAREDVFEMEGLGVGSKVIIQGLESCSHCNQKAGIIVEKLANGRYKVKMDESGRNLSVGSGNLWPPEKL
jgi:hypothetical protein